MKVRLLCLLFVAVFVALSLCGCGSPAPDTARAEELRGKYSFYDDYVKEIIKATGVTAEQADDIFITLANCGVCGELNYIIGSGGKYTVDVGTIGEGITNYDMTIDDSGVIVELKEGATTLYPAADTPADSRSEQSDAPGNVLLEDAIEDAIKGAGAEKESVTINDDLGSGSGKIALIYLKAKDNLTNSMIRTGALTEARDILKALQARDDVSEITIFWSFPFVDVYGNTQDETIIKVNVTKSTLDKINFDNFDYSNISEIADDYFEHSALSE